MSLQQEDSPVLWTDAAIDDVIIKYIKNKKGFLDHIMEVAAAPQDNIIKIDPTEDSEMMEVFNYAPEDMSDYILVSCLKLIKSEREDLFQNCLEHLKVRIINAPEITMKEWGPKYEGRPVKANALIVRQEIAETYNKYGRFKCKQGHERRLINPPSVVRCTECDEIMALDMATRKTGYQQTIMIQETMEEVHSGKPIYFPNTIIKDSDVRATYIGQRKKIIGVFRSIPRKGRNTNKIEINVIGMENLDDVEEVQPTNEQIAKFVEMSKQKNYLDILAESIAPEIKHETLAKLCILLALVGSQNEDRILGLLHVLLIGDPGTGKTKILEYIEFLIKKFGFAVGGTMSGSGVTVTMDTTSDKQRIPTPGIVPLCHKGVVGLDELNQLSDEDLGKLYECMSSGRIHYNKGGFDLNLDAHTTICAGANPYYYVYDTSKPISDNVRLPAPLLERFDIKLNIKKIDKTDAQKKEIYEHINLIQRIGTKKYIDENGLLQPEVLAAWISYAKTFNPVFTDASDKLALEFQLRMESITQRAGSLSVDRRFYYSIKRLAKAIARAYFSNEVTPDYIMYAIEIMKRTLVTFDMSVENGISLPETQSKPTNRPDAAKRVCMTLESKSKDSRFTEDEFVEECIKTYPKEFPMDSVARRQFYSMIPQMSNIGERYRFD